MEVAMIRANVMEDDEQTMARFLNGLNHPIKKIADFQPYSNLIELVHQATKAERQVQDNYKYAKFFTQVIQLLQHPSFNDSNNVYQAFYKQHRQVELQENFDYSKSSSYKKQLQAKSFIIIYPNR